MSAEYLQECPPCTAVTVQRPCAAPQSYSRSAERYNQESPLNNDNTGLILIAAVGIAALLFISLRTPHAQGTLASYKNAETWDIDWNADGLPTSVVIHRDAVQNGG